MLLVFLLFIHSDLTISLFDLYHTKYLVNEGDHDCLYRSVRTANNLLVNIWYHIVFGRVIHEK